MDKKYKYIKAQDTHKQTLEGRIRLSILIGLIYGSSVIFFGLILLSLYLQSVILFLLLIASYGFQLSKYCTKNYTFINFWRPSILVQYFQDWKVIKKEELDPTKSILSSHVHGVFNLGFVMNGPSYYDDFTLCGSRVLLSIPYTGMIFKLLGADSVDSQNVKAMLQKGKNFGLMPGGFEEATLTSKTEQRIYIKNRKGFIKYALQYGYKIYPAYIFGENQLYNVFEPLLNLRMKLNKFKIPGVLFWSRNLFFPDHRVRMHTVIGKGLVFPQIENPTPEQIDKYHAQYIEAIKTIYNEYKDIYREKSELKIY